MAASSHAKPRIAIIDVDAGIDDSQALVSILRSPEVRSGALKVACITCVAGNVPIRDVLRNVHIVLEAIGADVPVYAGAHKPLARKYVDARYWHGEDGLGNVREKWEAKMGARGDDDPSLPTAPVAMAQLAAEHPGEVEVLTLGPLTNLSIALNLFPSFASDVKRVVVMGGTSEMIGNATALAEFNAFADPEAAAGVVAPYGLGGSYVPGAGEAAAKHASAGKLGFSALAGSCKLEIVPWEACMRAGLPMDWCRSKEWLGAGTGGAARELLADASELLLSRLEAMGETEYASADPVAAATFLRPAEVGEECVLRAVTVETGAGHCQGAFVVDRRTSSLPPWDRAHASAVDFESWRPADGWGAALIHYHLSVPEVQRLLTESVQD